MYQLILLWKPLFLMTGSIFEKVFQNLPSGFLFDVATTTTPLLNSSVNKRFKIMASAISVTCEKRAKD